MTLKLCSVFDSASQTFGSPICVVHAGLAMRSFMTEMRSPESAWSKYPGDFALYEVGAFDDVTGLLIPLDKPRVLLQGSDVSVMKE